MPVTKALTLTTTPQTVIAQTVCHLLLIKEDESVAGWPTVNLIITKGAGDNNIISAGKSYTFQAPPRRPFFPGQVLGTVAVAIGSTNGIQDES